MDQVPEQLGHGRFLVSRVLGSGGEGTAVLARDRIEDRDVVLKWRNDGGAGEYAALATISHVGIVQVEGCFHEPSLGAEVLVEPWVEGRDLGRCAGTIDRDHLFLLAIDLVEALSFLHAAGLRHGDVKPANIVVRADGDGLRPVLIDFGMVAAVDAVEWPGATPAYLAPEVLSGGAPSAAVDWYALGLTLEQTSRAAALPLAAPDPVLLPERDDLDRLVRILLEAAPALRLESLRRWRRLREDRRPAARHLPPRLPFVGRSEVRDELLRSVVTALEGAPPVVRIGGGRGSGRGRLLEEVAVRLRASGIAAVSRRGDLDERRLLEELGFRLGRPLDRIRALLPRPDEALHRSLGECLRLAAGRPFVLLLDEDAAVSPPGRALLEAAVLARASAALLDEAERPQFAVVVAAGEGEAADRLLQPLEEAEIVELLKRLFATEPDEDGEALEAAARALRRASLGRPAAIDRLLRAAVAERAIGMDQGRFFCLDRWVERIASTLAAPAFPEHTPTVPSPGRLTAADRLERAGRLLSHDRCEEAEELLSGLADDADPVLAREADFLRVRIRLSRNRGREALALLDAMEAGITELDRSRLEAERAQAQLVTGRPKEAGAAARRAIAEAEIGSETAARGHSILGVAALQLGDLEGAEGAFEAAIELWRARGERKREAATGANAALVDQRAGRPARAAARLREALAILEDCGSADQAAACATNLGVVLGRLRRFDEAAQAHSRAASLFGLIGDRRRAAAALASRGIARAGDGILIPARRDLERALPALDAAEDHRARAIALIELARLDGLLGRRRRRRRRIDQARSVSRGAGLGAAGQSLEGEVESLEAPPPSPAAGPEGIATVAAKLRSPQAGERFEGHCEAAARRFEQGRSGTARLHLSRVLSLRRKMETDMSPTQRNVFRALVVNPAFERLEKRLTALARPATAAAQAPSPVIQAIEKLDSAPDLAAALKALAQGLFQISRTVRAFVLRETSDGGIDFLAAFDRNVGAVRDPAGEVSHRTIREAFERVVTMIVSDAAAHDRLGYAPSVQRLGLRSVACVPLRFRGRGLGLLYLDSPIESRVFDEATMSAIESFARLAAIVLAAHLTEVATPPTEKALLAEVDQRQMALATRTRELSRLRERQGFGVLVGRSSALEALNEMVRKIAPTPLSVLITGETGTGKELVAEAVHAGSSRRSRPFVAVNCAALPASLAESELFGHKKGAFTGADKDAPGLFRMADRGTLFLDEVGELPLELQAKLLRALQEGVIRPVGSAKDVEVDLRIVAATNRDLSDPARFRQDLWYRLAQVRIEVPPLRERQGDVPILVRHFVERLGLADLAFEKEALDALEGFDWPGNVRELENLVNRLALTRTAGHAVRLNDLPESIWNYCGVKPVSLAEAEARTIRQALRYTGGERKAAAKLLGISRSTLYEKLDRLGPEIAE